MKKTAILTQPLQSNYGGILQAFALQRTLIYLGCETITIDRQYNSVSRWKVYLSDIKNEIFNIFNRNNRRFTSKDRKYITKNPKNFIKKYINITEIIDSEEKLIRYFKENKYDAVIVGSDQVWRPQYSPNILNYYLNFINNESQKIKKISYAASFGVDYWEYDEKQTEEVKKLVQKFDAISVREKSAINLCVTNLGVNCDIVLDPTLLLTKDDYCNVLNLKKKRDTAFIFSYFLDKSSLTDKVLSYVQKKLNLKVKTNQPRQFIKNGRSINLEDYVYPPIEDWVSSFLDSDFIVTDSFHGTVFAIIFNKPFIVVANNERGVARFKSILEQLGLIKKLVDDENKITPFLFDEIQYEEVNKRIALLREQSIQFLKTNLI